VHGALRRGRVPQQHHRQSSRCSGSSTPLKRSYR
jgi:hypothetical protein